MTDKIKFVDISYLENTYRQLADKHKRAVFPMRNTICSLGEDPYPDVMDVVPYVELTRFQCQIIRDNITEIIRFADSGRIK